MVSSDVAVLYKNVHTLTPKELDELPHGAIQLDHNGNILSYNRYESSLSGIPRESAIGKNFFRDIAPCTDVAQFHGKFKEGIAKKQLHEKFRYHFPFKKNPRNVLITLFYHEDLHTVWVFIQPVD
jgi:photoactive yellow protein